MALSKARVYPVAPLIIFIVPLLILLLNLLGFTSSGSAVATAGEAEWSKVNIPGGGEVGNWVLASGSNVRYLTMASDGTLYAYANPSATNYTLFKSVDAGYSWSHTGDVRDTIVDLAIAPDDAGIIYYATPSDIYKSADAGKSFIRLPSNPGGAGADNITISCIDVTRLDGNSVIAVGTTDSDNSQYGGVYTLDESKLLPNWVDTNLSSFDTIALAFSPNFAADRQLVAVVTDEQDTLVTSRIASGAWNQAIADALIEGLSARTAAIAFPDDYDATNADYIMFVAVDTGSNNGGVYKIYQDWAPNASMAINLDIGAAYNLSNTDVTGLTISGNATAVSLMAGTAGSTQVYRSSDSGVSWTRSTKTPTGQSMTGLVMSPDFARSRIVYAVTSGTESAFSYSADRWSYLESGGLDCYRNKREWHY